MPVSVSKVDIWTAEISDQAGALDRILSAVANAGGNLECVIGRRNPAKPGSGHVYLTPIKGAKVQKAARDVGLSLAANISTLRVEMPNKPGQGQMPQAPADWEDLLAAIEKAHTDYRAVVESFSDAQLMENVKFFSAPKTMGDYQRIGFMWFLLSDQIHHRGQFSIYSRMADGKVPSIYGPSADEPWT